MNLDELEFKACDFAVLGDGNSMLINFQRLVAERANELLRERLGQAVEVFGTFEDIRPYNWIPDSPFHHVQISHRARLVCIEEIEP